MAAGGGYFEVQNKVLPGAYINVIGRTTAVDAGTSGTAALPMALNWGKEDVVVTVTADDFYASSIELFGYNYDAAELLPLREVFKHATKAYIYRVNGGAKATCTLADAVYSGTCGNNIKLTVAVDVDDATVYIVTTLYNGIAQDVQRVKTVGELKANAFVTFKSGATLEASAGLPLTGGTNAASVAAEKYAAFLKAMESYRFRTLACPVSTAAVATLFVNYTKRMREEEGVKFMTVIPVQTTGSDYESVIEVVNSVDGGSGGELVYWTAGADAAVTNDKSLSNMVYDGEYAIKADYSKIELTNYIKTGKFVFYRDVDEYRVLDDVNTLQTTTENKGDDFKSNQTIRLVDYIVTHIADIFNTVYLGKIPNNDTGRLGFRSEVKKLLDACVQNAWIEPYDEDKLTVGAGKDKDAVVAALEFTRIASMTKLYMTVYAA